VGELISRAEVIKEAAEIATVQRSALCGQAASIRKEAMTVLDLDAAAKLYNEAMDRILEQLTQGAQVRSVGGTENVRGSRDCGGADRDSGIPRTSFLVDG
jgi:hypothetical protein